MRCREVGVFEASKRKSPLIDRQGPMTIAGQPDCLTTEPPPAALYIQSAPHAAQLHESTAYLSLITRPSSKSIDAILHSVPIAPINPQHLHVPNTLLASSAAHHRSIQPPLTHHVHRDETPNHMPRPRHLSRPPRRLHSRHPHAAQPAVIAQSHIAHVQRHNERGWTCNIVEAIVAF